MALRTTGTFLVITPVETGAVTPVLTFYSARGLTQSLDLIASANIRRTINGLLLDLSREQFRKYKSTISCTDVAIPAFDDAWLGQTVIVDCIAELSYPTGGAAARPVVSGSSRTEQGFTFYCPQLTMIIMSISMSKDEWSANVGWSVELEEV